MLCAWKVYAYLNGYEFIMIHKKLNLRISKDFLKDRDFLTLFNMNVKYKL